LICDTTIIVTSDDQLAAARNWKSIPITEGERVEETGTGEDGRGEEVTERSRSMAYWTKPLVTKRVIQSGCRGQISFSRENKMDNGGLRSPGLSSPLSERAVVL
jgi:hypothetical protein